MLLRLRLPRAPKERMMTCQSEEYREDFHDENWFYWLRKHGNCNDPRDFAKKKITDELHLACGTNEETASFSDVLFLAVKPQFYEDVILSIRDHVKKDALIVTLAPGKTLEWLGSLFGEDRKIIRTMPNTPAMVGEGMTAVCPNHSVTDEELDTVLTLLSSFGQAEVIPENLIDVATAVSGSSPAYIFLAIEAMADGAVADGMPRNKAYRFAAQAVLGSAKMVLETGKHPGELKDMVCSPGGTTTVRPD